MVVLGLFKSNYYVRQYIGSYHRIKTLGRRREQLLFLSPLHKQRHSAGIRWFRTSC